MSAYNYNRGTNDGRLIDWPVLNPITTFLRNLIKRSFFLRVGEIEEKNHAWWLVLSVRVFVITDGKRTRFDRNNRAETSLEFHGRRHGVRGGNTKRNIITDLRVIVLPVYVSNRIAVVVTRVDPKHSKFNLVHSCWLNRFSLASDTPLEYFTPHKCPWNVFRTIRNKSCAIKNLTGDHVCR